VGNVKDIEPGIYRYLTKNHALKLEFKGDVRKEMAAAALNQQMLTNAPATIAFSVVYERATSRYGKRGKRYVYMDIGHAGQNVYLQCTVMGFGTVAIGAFTDEDIKKVLRLPDSEEPLYLMPFGKIK
jgi:SagB-type dehydrogenase family enzyme